MTATETFQATGDGVAWQVTSGVLEVQAMTEQDVDKQDAARRDMDYNIFLIYNYNFIQKKITIYVGSNDTMLRQSEVIRGHYNLY